MRILQDAKKVLDQAEKRCALETQLMLHEALRKNTRVWLEERQQRLVSLDSQTDPAQAINTAQVSLNIKGFDKHERSFKCDI